MEKSQQFAVVVRVIRGASLVLACLCASACGSSPKAANTAPAANASAAPTPRPAYAEADAAYYRARAGALATEAIDQIAGTDFWRFRRGRLYVPDASNIQELEERLAYAARSDSPAGVIDASAALLASDQADINAHMLRSSSFRNAEPPTE